MRKLVSGLVALALLTAPVAARNFAVPDKNPALTLAVPDKWKVDEIEYGYSAKSPDKEIFFSVEYTGRKKLDAMMKANKTWMKENEINGNMKPEERQMDFNGTSGEVLRFDTTDSNGKTIVDFVLLDGGEDHLIMLTLWASEDERENHKAEIASIMSSVRPIK